MALMNIFGLLLLNLIGSFENEGLAVGKLFYPTVLHQADDRNK